MNKIFAKRGFSFLLGTSLIVCGAALATPRFPASQHPAPDNSAMNKGNAQKGATTADQQKMNATDRDLTKKIRSAIMDDKSLSTYAHNVKIVSQDGKVTLKGPVRSEKEKADVEAKAVSVAGAENVMNDITVAPSKQ